MTHLQAHLPGDTPDIRVPVGLVRRDVVSFARRDGRLKGRPVTAWDEEHAAFLVVPDRLERDTSLDADWQFAPSQSFPSPGPLVVEVGTGAGDALVESAVRHPQINHLGVEVYRPGVAQTLIRVRRLGLDNVRLIEADAASLLRTGLVEGSVEEIRIFFPDPWPKARHHKRRLVTAPLLADAARALKDGGVVRLATDWAEYAEAMLEAADAVPALRNPHAPWAPRFPDRPLTRFERKGLAAGREIRDLELVREPR